MLTKSPMKDGAFCVFKTDSFPSLGRRQQAGEAVRDDEGGGLGIDKYRPWLSPWESCPAGTERASPLHFSTQKSERGSLFPFRFSFSFCFFFSFFSREKKEKKKNRPLPYNPRYSSISAALVSGFALGNTFSTVPSGAIMKVLRTTPMDTLPYSFFSCHTPKA